MRNIPPEVILSWPTPNYTNPETRGDALVVVNSILIIVVAIVVALRLYVRLVVKRWFGTDDALIILALIFDVGLTACVLLANQRFGWDRHVYDIPITKFAPTSKIAMSAKLMFVASASFTRLSLFGFYYRLARDSGKETFLWLVHISVAYTICTFIAFVFLGIFQCNPISNYWSYGAPADTCINEGTATLAVGVINCVADFFCTVLPIPLVAQLNMPTKQRIAVVFVFSLGFIVTGAGVVRTWYIYVSLIREWDQTWYAYPLWICAAVEIHLGVVCASAPVLRPLLAKIPFALSSAASKVSRKWPGSSNYSSRASKSNPSALSSSGIKSTQDKSATESDVRRKSQLTRDDLQSQPFNVQDFELGQWEDVERAVRAREPSASSRNAILGSDDGASREASPRQYQRPLGPQRVLLSDMYSRGLITPSDESTESSDLPLENVSTRSSEIIHHMR